MSETAEAILLGVLSSSAICELVRYVIGKWKAKDQMTIRFDEVNKSIESLKIENAKSIEELKEELQSMKRNEIRLQLMVLMSDYPKKKEEIMLVAERYFSELGGDWYLTDIFKSWLDDNGIEEPTWID